MNDDTIVVQKQATKGDVITDHINGMGGYEIAEKYGLDTEKVKQIISDADAQGLFIPGGATGDADSPVQRVTPLKEGENPQATVETTQTKATTKNNP